VYGSIGSKEYNIVITTYNQQNEYENDKIYSYFIILPLLVFAHHPNSEMAHLPNAGLTPDSPFYFLDKIGETLREFITFNPQSKARLHVQYAGERIAEIKIILESKGLEAASFAAVQANLEKHTKKAVEIVEKEKSKGNDVSELAAEIVDNFHLQRVEAKEAFGAAKEAFQTKKALLHDELLIAITAGNVEEQERIRAELATIEAVKDEAEAKKDEAIETLEAEKERLQDELEEEKRLEDEARDIVEEAKDEAKKAEEKQQELKEKMEEEQAKTEEKLKEADAKEAERIMEEAKREEEQLKKEEEKAVEEQKRAEEKQMEAEKKLMEMKKEAEKDEPQELEEEEESE